MKSENDKPTDEETKQPAGGTPPEGKKPEGNKPERNKPKGKPPGKEEPSKEAPTNGEKRKTDNRNMYSVRVPDKWFALLEIVTARMQPGQKIGDALAETLERGIGTEDEAELTATVHQHPTLDGEEYIRIRAGHAPILKTLKSFRADLLQIDQYPDDAERTEGLANLLDLTKNALLTTSILNTRLARIALLPDIPSGDDLDHIFELKQMFLDLRNNASTPKERAKYTLGLKLLGPYLP